MGNIKAISGGLKADEDIIHDAVNSNIPALQFKAIQLIGEKLHPSLLKVLVNSNRVLSVQILNYAADKKLTRFGDGIFKLRKNFVGPEEITAFHNYLNVTEYSPAKAYLENELISKKKGMITSMNILKH